MKDPDNTIWLTVGDEYDAMGFDASTPCTLYHGALYPDSRDPILTLRQARKDDRFQKGDLLVHRGGGWDVASWAKHQRLHGTWEVELKTLPPIVKQPEGSALLTKSGWEVFLDTLYEHLRNDKNLKAKLVEAGIEIDPCGWKVRIL